MTAESSQAEYEGLLNLCIEQRLNECDEERLAELMGESDERYRQYIEYVELHANIWLCQGCLTDSFPERFKIANAQHLTTASASELESENSDSDVPAPPVRDSWLNRASRRPIPPSIAVAIIAVAALLFGLAVTPLSRFLADDDDGSDNPSTTASAEEVATLTGTQFVDWMPGEAAGGRDPRLTAGQRLAFKSGVVEITYDSGVKVLIEGPAEFQAIDTKAGKLDVGRLVLLADGEASKGFVIETPCATIEDLGTEFCVDVSRNGRTDVLVTEGKISVASRLAPESEAPLVQETLIAGGAARVEPGAQLELLANNANLGRFARLRKLSAEPLGSEPPDTPVLAELSLWLAADRGVQAEDGGRVTLWRDAREPGEGGMFVGRAPVEKMRPQLISDAIAGNPAIRFDGHHQLILPTPEELGIENSGYELFIVAQSDSPKTQFLFAGSDFCFEYHINHFQLNVGAQFIPLANKYLEVGSQRRTERWPPAHFLWARPAGRQLPWYRSCRRARRARRPRDRRTFKRQGRIATRGTSRRIICASRRHR